MIEMIVIIFLSRSVAICKHWFLEDLFRTMCKFTITQEKKNTLMDENISFSCGKHLRVLLLMNSLMCDGF